MSRLRRDLLEWFDAHKRDLPWRRTRDAYAIWISEVMLQQTQVSTVIPYWTRFLERFPDVQALARAALPDVFALWKGLGYYSRARNLHKAAQQVSDVHHGALPRTAGALIELPGFGRYTAGAVASIAFGEAAPLVDGNVARVFARLFEVEGAPPDRAREAKLWSLAEAHVKGDRPGDWNQALMELGATVCRVDKPDCPSCPVRRHCRALKSDRVAELPPPRVRAQKQKLRMAVAVCRKNEALLFARRAEGGLFGGLWELPSAEVTGGDPTRALNSLLGEVKVGALLGSVRRILTHRELTLDLYEVRGVSLLPSTPRVQEWRWSTAEAARALGMSTAMAKALAVATDSASGKTNVRGGNGGARGGVSNKRSGR